MQNLNLREHGIEIKPDLVSNDLIQSVISEVSTSDQTMQKHEIRNAEKKFASISNVINSSGIVEEAQRILGQDSQVVRVIFLIKHRRKTGWLHGIRIRLLR